jgi:hypothetical protein
MLAGVLSGTPNTGAQPAPITVPEKMREALKASYANLQKAIAGLSDNDLQDPVKLFGRDMTKQGALMLILEDQHEHLGQSIHERRFRMVHGDHTKLTRCFKHPILRGSQERALRFNRVCVPHGTRIRLARL